MTIFYLNDIKAQHQYLGGKAYNLALLHQQGLPVPDAIVLDSYPNNQSEWDQIYSWWKSTKSSPLAIRSSASDEDNPDVSFAGQNSSFLNVKSEADIQKYINLCFKSIHKNSSMAYRKHFLGNSNMGTMNVVLQVMVNPKFAGVYFSEDPTGKEAGDLIEFVEGLGESLVSGERSPYKINNGNINKEHNQWNQSYTDSVQKLGLDVYRYIKQKVDMEWAIDHSGTLFLLQARPITATYSHSNRKKILEAETLRLNSVSISNNTSWDGQTFAEFSKVPSYMTFKIYEQMFSSHMAFGQALNTLGYNGFNTSSEKETETILDRILGRAYINLEKMCPLYFGDIPYTISPKPRPHLVFDPSKITLKSFIRTPLSILNMIKVGWNLSSKRSSWLMSCKRELISLKSKLERPVDPSMYSTWSDEDLLKRFSKECHVYTKYQMHWPFVLIILTESTLHSLMAILKSILGKDESQVLIKKWMSMGLKTATFEMNSYLQKAKKNEQKIPFFLAKYGHRGVGELDLKNPRWIELDKASFFAQSSHQIELIHKKNTVIDEIDKIQSFKKSIIKSEWRLLKSMLEQREKWKMETLKTYANIRFIALEIGKRNGLNNDIFHLGHQEIIEKKLISIGSITQDVKDLINYRKQENKIFKLYSIPPIVNKKQLLQIISGNYEEKNSDSDSFDGEALSPGLMYGVAKVIEHYDDIDINEITKETIIITETTDPGWTPLFTKAGGIIVEKGGILSHSAIVAREMGIPAVSGIYNCTKRFKDGDKLCLDGNYGHVIYDKSN